MERWRKQKSNRSSKNPCSEIVKVTCYNSQSVLTISFNHVEKAVLRLLEKKGIVCDEVIVHFTDKKTISKLHKKFFHDSTPTDCISFPIDSLKESDSDGYCILGEIFICPEVALTYSQNHIVDPYQELSLYLIHGLLHLLGYDDQSPKEEKIMRSEEEKCLAFLEEEKCLLTA